MVKKICPIYLHYQNILLCDFHKTDVFFCSNNCKMRRKQIEICFLLILQYSGKMKNLLNFQNLSLLQIRLDVISCFAFQNSTLTDPIFLFFKINLWFCANMFSNGVFFKQILARQGNKKRKLIKCHYLTFLITRRVMSYLEIIPSIKFRESQNNFIGNILQRLSSSYVL